MRILTLAAAFVVAACCVSACKNFPGADGRYAHLYPGHSGEGGTGLPATPYDPDWRDKPR